MKCLRLAGIALLMNGCCSLNFRQLPPALQAPAAPVINGPWTDWDRTTFGVGARFSAGGFGYMSVRKTAPTTTTRGDCVLVRFDPSTAKFSASALPSCVIGVIADARPPNSSEKFVAAVLENGVVTSEDGGASWSPATPPRNDPAPSFGTMTGHSRIAARSAGR